MGTKRYKQLCGRKFVLVNAGKIALRGGFWGLKLVEVKEYNFQMLRP
jgi:hypothetical protein